MKVEERLSNLRLQGSCSCINVVRPRGLFTLTPKEATIARITCYTPDVRDVRQTIDVIDERNVVVGEVLIEGRTRPICVTPSEPVVARRALNLSDVNVDVPAHFEPGLSISAIECQSSQFTVARSLTSDAFTVSGGRVAADGYVSVPVRVRFKAKGMEGDALLSLRLKLLSSVRVDPADKWLGSAKRGTTLKVSVCLTAPRASDLRDFSLAPPDDVKVIHFAEDETKRTYDLEWTPKAKFGVVSTPITITRRGLAVASVRLSGLVVR